MNFAKMQDFVQPLIKPDEELTIDYGVGYFGRNQKNCQCPTCEAGEQGAFRKRKRGERKNIDLWTLEEEKKIVKVCLPFPSFTFILNIF